MLGDGPVLEWAPSSLTMLSPQLGSQCTGPDAEVSVVLPYTVEKPCNRQPCSLGGAGGIGGELARAPQLVRRPRARALLYGAIRASYTPRPFLKKS
jgi:hypothetical protein